MANVGIGEVMSDGSVVVGMSAETGRTLFVKPNREGLRLNWDQAMKYAHDLNSSSSHNDWRIPSIAELRTIYENRVAIQGSVFPDRGIAKLGNDSNSITARERWRKGLDCSLLWVWSSELRDSPGTPVVVNWIASKINPYYDESARTLNMQDGSVANNLRDRHASVLCVRG